MFAHCLLPALLLLATVDYCTTLRRHFTVTEVIAGNPEFEHGRIEEFFIPDKQCYGVLITSQQKPLVCPEHSAIAGVTVTVFDDLRANITISELDYVFDHVMIVRGSCSDKAYVFVEVACQEG